MAANLRRGDLMRFLTVPLLLALTGCAINISPDSFAGMTPQEARRYGVDVPDDAKITGIIVASYPAWSWSGLGAFPVLERECGLTGLAGCAKSVNGERFPAPDHRYEIWYADKCAAYHEAAHALFEEWVHTQEFYDRVGRYGSLAACQ